MTISDEVAYVLKIRKQVIAQLGANPEEMDWRTRADYEQAVATYTLCVIQERSNDLARSGL